MASKPNKTLRVEATNKTWKAGKSVAHYDKVQVKGPVATGKFKGQGQMPPKALYKNFMRDLDNLIK